MKSFHSLFLLLATLSLLIPFTASADDELKLENLMREKLEGATGLEVVVSKVHIPANTSLPKHWHSGEEFVYVLEGSVTLWQEGKDNQTFTAGDTGKVPLKQVHTAVTSKEGATLLVFRVHEEGEPERTLVE